MRTSIISIIFTAVSLAVFGQAPQKSFTEKLDGIQTTNKELTKNSSTDNSSVGQGGNMSTSVPLVNVASRTMQFPIQLQYTAGIKVDQQSGAVGLGWAMPIGSIVRDYGAFEPDYTSTENEADMKIPGEPDTSFYHGYLNPDGNRMDPWQHRQSLIYDVVEVQEDRTMPLSDFYHMSVPGLGSNTFWNGGTQGGSHAWKWNEDDTWRVEHEARTFSIDQEFSRINEIDMGILYNSTKQNFDIDNSFAAAIGVLPYVINGKAYKPSDIMAVSPNERKVVYEDFGEFIITNNDGVQYVFGRALRGQKFVFSDDPYWSTKDAGTGNFKANGNFWKTDYIAEWLLTEIRSADYQDLNNNGFADDEDAGDWIRFEYTETTQFIDGVMLGNDEIKMDRMVPKHREWSSFSQTDQASSLMRERAYLTKIVTPVQELDFTISQRFDVDHDYYTKPANQTAANNYYWEDRWYGTQGDAEDFDILYPVETMKYDTIRMYSRLMDKALYPDENLLTGAVVLNYADKGSADELAVSEYLIRNNSNVQQSGTHNPSTGGTFDIDAYKQTDKRGKTTLLGIDLFGGDMDAATKTSYEFEYAYNPSFNEAHKRSIMRKYAFPSLRTGSGIAYPKSTALLSYKETRLNSSGVYASTDVNHTGITPSDFQINFPYKEVYYQLDFADTNDINSYVQFGYTTQAGFALLDDSIVEHPLFPIQDVFGYLYAENCTECPKAWSLTKITYPTGGEVSFEYEQGEFLKSTDQPNWNIGENNFPIISQYNNLARQRSYVQDAYNQYVEKIDPNLMHKTLTATFEAELPSKYGIRLKSKTMDDRINPTVTVNYAYQNGHFTSAPAEYVQSYTQGYNTFISRENRRHQWEIGQYGPNSTNHGDYQNRMSSTTAPGFSLDEYEAIFFYEHIDEIYADSSFMRTHYAPMHNNTSVDYDTYNIFCYRYPGTVATYDGRYIIAREGLSLYPVAPVLQESYAAGASTPYQWKKSTYQRIQLRGDSLGFDYTMDTINPSNTINMWGLLSDYYVYVPITQGYYSGDYTYDGSNFTLSFTFFGGGGNGDTGFAQVDGVSINKSLTIPTGINTPYQYERWGSFKTLLRETESDYKGLTTKTTYDYDANMRYQLIEERSNASFTDETYIKTHTYAINDEGSGYFNAFYNRNLWNVRTRENLYLDTIADSTLISAQMTTYDISGYLPRVVNVYQFEDDLDANGTCVLDSFIIANSTHPKWRIAQMDVLDYNNQEAPISARENRLYNKSVFGSNTAIPKANYAYTEHSFDATYSGFEDLYHQKNISDWEQDSYKDEQWFEFNSSTIPEPAYSMSIPFSPCGIEFPSGVNTIYTKYNNVVTVDNVTDLAVGDIVEVELIGSNNSDPNPYSWSTSTTISKILQRSNYWADGTGAQTIQDSMKTYILCFTDTIKYPGSTLQAPFEPTGVMQESAYNTIALTKVNKLVKLSLSDMYSRTGEYSYKLRTHRDTNDPFNKTPIRPVMVEGLSASSNCITENPADAKASEQLITECFWNYEASVWLNYSQDMVTSIPSGTAPQKSADAVADGIYRRETVSETDNGSRVKIICDVWNSDRTSIVDQYIYYPDNLSSNWQQYTVDIPVRRGAQRWLDVYVQNEKPQYGTISTEESMSLFVDDICVYPRGAKYNYTTVDKFGNPTFQTNNDDVFVEMIYDQKGRPTTQKNQYGSIVSEMSYFEKPNWINQNNHITQRQWIDNGVYNETRYYLDGLGKTKQVILSDITRDSRIVTETNEYNSKGQVSRAYKPYAISGSGLGDGHNSTYATKIQTLYGSDYAYTSVKYEALPEEKISSVEPPRTDTESVISASQSDDVSQNSITHPYMSTNNVFPSGTVLIHETIDANGNKVWTHMDNLGRVIMEEHEIGNDYIQNADGSITVLGTTQATAKTWFVYDGASRITKVIDPDGKETTYEYNSLGVVTKKTTADQGVSEMCYDKYGQVRFIRNAKDDAAVTTNTWGTDQFSYMKYDEWGRVIEGGFLEAAQSNPSGIFTPTIFFGDTSYLNDQDFPLETSALVQVHQKMEYDGSRDQFDSEALLSSSVMSDHVYTPATMTYTAGATDAINYTYMADGQAAEVEYDYDGLANTHKFEPVYNSKRLPIGKKYYHPTNSLWDFTWNTELDNLGRIKQTSTTHNSTETDHGSYYFDVLGNPLMKGLGSTTDPNDPHIDYQVVKWDIRDQVEHYISKDFRYGLEHNENGNITSQYWSNEYFDPTTGSTSNINQYAYSYDKMQRLIGADYLQTSVTGNPFDYYANISTSLPNDFDCSVNEIAFDVVFDPIFDEMDDNIANRVNTAISREVNNSLGILKVEYLANNVPYANMTTQDIDDFLNGYIDAVNTARGNSLSWEEYRATQLNDTTHLNSLTGAATPDKMKYTKIKLSGITYAPAVNCNPNPDATIYGYLPTFPYPSTMTNDSIYDVAYWYTANGNLTDLDRNDEYGYTTEQDYTYGTSSNNQLSSVQWNVQNGTTTTDNYGYDATGNLLNDSRNGVTNIDYISYNNMPQSITNSTGTTNYRYDAENARSVKNVDANYTEYYLDGVIVNQGDSVISYQTTEGYAVPASSTVRYFYNSTDWLGSNRAVYSADGNIKNVTDHYPFGMRMPARWLVTDNEGKRYQFTGHEYDGETGYGYHGARYYNRELGRYMNVDAYAEKFYNQSPYVYAGNRVIDAIDVNGDSIIVQEKYQNSEEFLMWRNSKAGKKFYKRYGEGGEYEHINIYIGDPETSDEEHGQANTMTYVVSPDGTRKILGTKQDIQSTPERRRYKYTSEIKEGDTYYFKIALRFKDEPTTDSDEYIKRDRAMAILHESQHVRISHSSIRTFGTEVYSSDKHHHMMLNNMYAPSYYLTKFNQNYALPNGNGIYDFNSERWQFLKDNPLPGETDGRRDRLSFLEGISDFRINN